MTQLLTTRSGGSSSEITTTKDKLEQILSKLDQLETRIQANEISSSSFGIPLLDYAKSERFDSANTYIAPSNGIIIVDIHIHIHTSNDPNMYVTINGYYVSSGFDMSGFNYYDTSSGF